MKAGKWENYVLRAGRDFTSFWTAYLAEKERNVLYILGMGFDPRTNTGIKVVYAIDSQGKRDAITLRYHQSDDEIGTPNDTRVDENINDLNDFLNSRAYGAPIDENIILYSPDHKTKASASAQNAFAADEMVERVKTYSDIIVDISAMPRGIFMPILNVLLKHIDEHNNTDGNALINLHVIVTENPLLDAKIYDKAPEEDADFIHGFRVPETAAIRELNEVWIPLLGENQTEQFKTLSKSMAPVETSPVLPFPAKDLRRGDMLIKQYKDFLFNDSDFQPKNIVYADEANPFQVYRVLNQMVHRYTESFKLINGCKIIISTLSSKLLSIGAFLSVYEAKSNRIKAIGIKHVESKSQDFTEEYKTEKEAIDKQNKLFEIWLAGEAYA